MNTSWSAFADHSLRGEKNRRLAALREQSGPATYTSLRRAAENSLFLTRETPVLVVKPRALLTGWPWCEWWGDELPGRVRDRRLV